MGFLSVPTNGSLILVTSARFFSFCLFVLSNFDMIVLFSYILFLSLRSLFFSEIQKGSGSGWDGR